MAANNSVHLIGHITRDPEMRVTPRGTSIVGFSLAVNRRWQDESGQAKEEVTFVECECWGKRGEAFAKYHKKGDKAAVDGRLKMDEWEDKETRKKRSRLKVIVEDFEFVNPKRSGEEDSAGDAPPPRRQAAPRPAPSPSGLEDDVPF